MAENYEIRDVPAQPCVYIRRTIPQNKLGEFFMEVLPKVFAYVSRRGQPAGPPFGRYPEWGETDCTVEAGVTTTGQLPGEGEILSGTFGGGKALMGVHVGSYDGLKESFYKLGNYAVEHGHPRKVPFEVYVDDPGSKPEAEIRTEIYWPID